ncbi:HD-GYP domain-containing protein [Brevibacillus sp. SYSU BS000544]|uniref:HD-GYP domain-containing protein n=1 Tax=Brevibacillus sp. SYSU BS000544 TaxID=3416443 RepID=UPI003CE4F124
MRLISLSKCLPGQRLAKTIYSDSGVVLVGEGVELNQRMLDRLQSYNVTAVYIHDERTADIVVEDVISEATRKEAMKTINETFKTFHDEPQRTQKFIQNKQLGKQFRQVMNSVIDELKANRNAMSLLGSVCGTDHYIFQHSFNVALYSTAVGLQLQLNEKELVELGLGALLHDIGKMMIPLEILQKPGRLSDEEFNEIKKHTEIGFEILRRQDDIPLLAAHCAYQHHERLDGSGYPRQLKEKDIHRYAKILAVGDVFDALTTHRVYRRAMLPHQAMEILYSGVDKLYIKDNVQAFRDSIALYPIGLGVTLNTGEEGVVIDYNRGAPSRPIVRILTDEKGNNISVPFEIDLSKRLNIFIESCDLIM